VFAQDPEQSCFSDAYRLPGGINGIQAAQSQMSYVNSSAGERADRRTKARRRRINETGESAFPKGHRGITGGCQLSPSRQVKRYHWKYSRWTKYLEYLDII
jgi:hypothetical protein